MLLFELISSKLMLAINKNRKEWDAPIAYLVLGNVTNNKNNMLVKLGYLISEIGCINFKRILLDISFSVDQDDF